MMKKIVSSIALFCLIACLCAFYGVFPIKASANGGEKLADFGDDFESYQTGNYIENTPTFSKKWTNNYLAGGEAQGMDAHLIKIAKPEYENGSSGNKVLHLNNAATGLDSFFHIGPAGDYRVKNFTVSFRVKFLTESVGERSWVGISFRKKAESAYTGTNNLLFTIQRYVSGNKITAHSYAIFDGGSANDISDVSMKSLFGDKLDYSSSVYTVPDGQSNADLPWVEYKLTANGNHYQTFVNGINVVDCTFDIPSYDYFGYLSLNCCTANVLVDDFALQVQDETLPPVIGKLNAPVLTLNEEEKSVSWEAIDGANLYTVYLDGTAVKTFAKTKYTFESDLPAGEYKIAVKAVSEDAFVVRDSDLSEEITYTVKAAGGEKKGCKGSLLSPVSLGAVVLLSCATLKKKRK